VWLRVGWRRDGAWPASDSASRPRAASLQRVSMGARAKRGRGAPRGRVSCTTASRQYTEFKNVTLDNTVGLAQVKKATQNSKAQRALSG